MPLHCALSAFIVLCCHLHFLDAFLLVVTLKADLSACTCMLKY